MMKTLKALLLPLARARALRRDDRAQVMVISAVMVFVATIFTVQMLNTSEMVFNRIRAQNAADAAADAFALWQARGINTMQFMNDIHYDADMVLYWIIIPSCTARIGCILLNAIPIVGPGLYLACCNITGPLVTASELAQSLVEGLALTLQWFIKYTFPAFGIIRANTVAEGNGADPLVGSVLASLQSTLNQLGLGGIIRLGVIIKVLNKIPGLGDIYALPIRPDLAFPLHVRPKISTPSRMPWKVPTALVVACRAAPCVGLPVVCRGNNSKPKPPGLMAIAQELKMGIKAITGNDCGWADTYYYGYPGFNTWLAGLQSQDAIKRLKRNPWLNPGTSLSNPDRAKQTYRGVIRGRGSEFTYLRKSIGVWENPGFLGLASSQIEGDPLQETSDNNWKVSRPKLISVHIPQYNTKDQPQGNNAYKDLESIMIYH